MTEDLDMADLRREMIDDYLKSRQLTFLRYEDGDFAVRFRWGTRKVDFVIGTDETGAMLWFEAVASTTFPLEQMPFLLLVTNQYMLSHRWPRLKVAIDNDEASIVSDGHLGMLDSLEECELGRFLDSGIGATAQFWEEFKLPDSDSLDAGSVGGPPASCLGEPAGRVSFAGYL